MTTNEAERAMQLILELWPNQPKPDALLANRMQTLAKDFPHVGIDQAEKAILAAFEEQRSTPSARQTEPNWEKLTTRLRIIERGESGENAVRDFGPTGEGDAPRINWGRNAQGELTQGGRTAAEWADSHERMADAMVRKVAAPKAREHNYRLACKLRNRAASLRANGFTQHAPFTATKGV